MEPAPEGAPLPPGPVLALHDELAPEVRAALDVEWVQLARTAGVAECEKLLATGSARTAQTLVDARLLGWELGDVEPAAGAQVASLAVFRLARALFTTELAITRVVVPTALDGTAGFSNEQRAGAAAAVAFGAAGGAWKSVVREWPEARAGMEVSLSLVDLPAAPLDGGALDALKQAIERRGPTELATAGGRTQTPVLRPVEPKGAPSLDNTSVILLTGGARGVTAKIAHELAQRFQCRLVLADLCGVAQKDTPKLDPGSARKRAREELGPDAAMPDVNARVGRLLGEQQAAETVAALEALGSEVLYCQGDITDPEVAARMVGEAEARFGPIDVAIHGAGIDRSRTVLAKDEAEVATVVAVKTAAAALFAAARARPVGFCSVSGRLGNAGQIDYCAANEALAKLALSHGGLALDFTAWADIGMAAPIAKAMRERGVDPLDPDDAARIAVDLIAGGAAGEYVLAGRMRPHDPSAETVDTLGGDVLFEVPGAELSRSTNLALEELAFLTDHRPTSAGVLPAVVALQAMIDAATTVEPGLPLRGVRDLKIAQAVKVFEGKPVTVQVEAARGATEAGAAAFATRVVTDAGVHHSATVMLGGEPGQTGGLEVGSLKPGPSGRDLYKTFFHGPSFQVFDRCEIGDDGLVATSFPLVDALGRDIPAAARPLAMARELVLQAAGAFLMTAERRLALPVGIAELVIKETPRPGERVEAVARYRRADSDDDLYLFDALLRGEDGRDLERMTGLSFKYLGRL